jgi:DNA-binding response OmpR family regulator/anti-sigma regulatory factor (Ser/Thr protein kinase)
MFRSAIESAGLALEADFEDADEDGASVRMIDPEAWVKIVGNLLSNAYKFTDTGSIRVGLQQTADGVVLTVRDTGSGIAEEDAGMVFQRFHQVASRPARGIAGTGIGLALVKDLVEAQGGQVTLESHPGRGSAFTVRIPAALVSREAALRAELALARTARGLLPERQPSDVLDVPSDLAGTRPEEGQPVLLLVEDNDDLRGYLTRLLTDDGWSVVAVPDAPSALQVESVPDLVLCDVMLPGPSGLDLVTTMRATAEWATVPVVLLTARSGAKEVASGLAVGANDYVGKPFDPIELLARLRTHHELALDRSQALVEAEEKAGQLRTALTSSRVIGMAVGVLMSSHRVTSDHAFDLLRVHSNNTNRKIRDVAEDVVLTGRIPPTP